MAYASRPTTQPRTSAATTGFVWSSSAVVFFLAMFFAAPLSAQTVPSEPTKLTATMGDGSITLKWGAPKWDGGSPITSYTMICRPEGGVHPYGIWNTWTFTGLTNGTTYGCSVWASNAMGEGAQSSVSATPARPNPK